jgi:hypothetical protein
MASSREISALLIFSDLRIESAPRADGLGPKTETPTT